MSRAHLVIDQLRGLIGQSRGDEIILLTCEPTTAGASSEGERQSAVVVHHAKHVDFATMMLIGWSAGEPSEHLGDAERLATEVSAIERATDAMSRVLDPLLHQRGARFLQFATDVADTPSGGTPDVGATPARETGPSAETPSNALPQPSSSETSSLGTSHSIATAWQDGMSLRHIGNLEYLSGPVDPISSAIETMVNENAIDPANRLTFEVIDSFADFAELVDRTYSETMDCPLMSTFRNAEQTLGGYRLNDAYAPDLWFAIRRSNEDTETDTASREQASPGLGDAIGCLLMGRHVSQRTESDQVDPNAPESSTDSLAAVVCELVYMGLVPEVRGHRLGRQIIKHAASVSRQIGADRMILAVDETNRPARDLYHRVGLQPMMRESVWGKLVTEEHTKKL